ncbi:hypothetical protein [Rhodospirillum centenum]|uniref:DUF3618 domain-containing protein n=1 Tax=Rhodospirillum centenum (strain ATCC 51521 / SW) TaxID=414684 RepID=B6IR47_RHOCS|nr:hypothetical protein [Rhodospirillum centenum]ACI97933.1 conserved hypothetical protein [Rhodospirillum centenum SW]
MSYDYQGGYARSFGDDTGLYGRGGYGEDERGWGGMLQDNTVPLALIGIGVGWMLLSGGGRSAETGRAGYGGSAFGGEGRWAGDRTRGMHDHEGGRIGQAMSSLREGAEHLRERAGDRFEAVRHRAGDAMEHARDRFSGRSGRNIDTGAGYDRIADYDSRDEDLYGDDLYGPGSSYASYGAGQGGGSWSDRASGLMHDAGQRAGYATESFWDMVEEHPLAAGLLSLALGAAVGATLPSTRTEDEWLGQYRDRLADDLWQRGEGTARDATDVAKHALQAGVDAARETAEREADERGLTGSRSDDPTRSKADAGSR